MAEIKAKNQSWIKIEQKMIHGRIKIFFLPSVPSVNVGQYNI